MTAAALVLTATLVATLAAAAAAQPEGGLAGEIRARERALADATLGRDGARLDALLAPDFVMRAAPDIDRATWIRNAVTLCWGERSDIAAFAATARGEVVVATFELTFYADPATCAPAVLRSLVTDVWTRHADGWRLQVRHAGPAQAGAGLAAQYGAVPLPPPTWEIASELSLVATGGNTSTRTIGVGGSAARRAGATRTRAAVAYLTSEAGGLTRARSLRTDLRVGYRLRPHLELFGEGAYARDRFAGIDNRVTTAAGAAYTATLPRRATLTAEGSLGHTDERLRDARTLRFLTAHAALEYAWPIAPGTELRQEVSLTGDLQTAANWRGASATAISVALTRVLSLKGSHAVDYRNTPVAGFGRVDMRSGAALVVSWQRRPPAP